MGWNNSEATEGSLRPPQSHGRANYPTKQVIAKTCVDCPWSSSDRKSLRNQEEPGHEKIKNGDSRIKKNSAN